MKYALLSDRGSVRKKNEDYIDNLKVSDGSHLFVLADGMGGHNKGEVASETAVETVIQYFQKYSQVIETLCREGDIENTKEFLQRSIDHANDKVYQLAKEEDKKGMGTTLVLTYLMNKKALIANVGDSRAYLYRGGKIGQLTIDNSYVQELIRSGIITEEQAKNHSKKNVVTRAIGTSLKSKVDFYEIDIEPGDIILMCSDGLSNMLEEEEIAEILSSQYMPMFSCEQLVSLAKQKGGYDNISIILIHCC